MIGIIDDDKMFINELKGELKQYSCFLNKDIKEYDHDFQNIQLDGYELLFIDIELMETDGISLAKKINKKETRIVFVSHHDSLVYDCFDIHLYFFIRKDHYKEDLKRLVKK